GRCARRAERLRCGRPLRDAVRRPGDERRDLSRQRHLRPPRPRLRAPGQARRAGRVLGGRAVNLFDAELQHDDDDPPGYSTSYLRTAALLGGKRIAFNVFELPAGQSVCPYHYESTSEEWIIVLTGRPTVRTPEGERELGPWDCVFCPAGEAGAHKVTNRG